MRISADSDERFINQEKSLLGLKCGINGLEGGTTKDLPFGG